MKITKSKINQAVAKSNRELANVDCKECPECGEIRKYHREGFSCYGIFNATCKTWVTGFFKFRHKRIDCYHCYTCGCEWESEAYEEMGMDHEKW